MWPGTQPPGGEQNPQDQSQNPYQQPGYQQPNPYQQPGHQAPNPYQQPAPGAQGQWSTPNAPVPPGGPGTPGGSGDGGGGRRTKVVSVVMAAAVVVAAGVTGAVLLGGEDDEDGRGGKDTTAGSPARPGTQDPGAADDGSQDTDGSGDGGRDADDDDLKPTIKGWHVVVNPKWGTAFDVPPEWEVQNPGSAIALEDIKTGKPMMTMSAPAYLEPAWCVADDNKDGRTEDHELAAVGTKGAKGARNTAEVAVNQVGWWVYGAYTQPDKKSFTNDDEAEPYTTRSGLKGSIARARSTNTPQKGKCATDGKAITFGFKNAEGEYVSWSLYGAKGVPDEIPEKTVMKILSTVRTHKDPTES